MGGIEIYLSGNSTWALLGKSDGMMPSEEFSAHELFASRIPSCFLTFKIDMQIENACKSVRDELYSTEKIPSLNAHKLKTGLFS